MAVIFLSDEDRAGRRSVKVFSTIQGEPLDSAFETEHSMHRTLG
jgi:hypothetical protein